MRWFLIVGKENIVCNEIRYRIGRLMVAGSMGFIGGGIIGKSKFFATFFGSCEFLGKCHGNTCTSAAMTKTQQIPIIGNFSVYCGNLITQ